jgi:hypothetical protein
MVARMVLLNLRARSKLRKSKSLRKNIPTAKTELRKEFQLRGITGDVIEYITGIHIHLERRDHLDTCSIAIAIPNPNPRHFKSSYVIRYCIMLINKNKWPFLLSFCSNLFPVFQQLNREKESMSSCSSLTTPQRFMSFFHTFTDYHDNTETLISGREITSLGRDMSQNDF